MSAPLPRLLYVGEVPVRNLSAGPALLFRLLEAYPPGDLVLAESNDNRPQPEAELPAVATVRFFLLRRRLLNSRLGTRYGAWVYRRAPARGAAAARSAPGPRPDAVLGVAHGFGWRAAAGAARALRCPLHLIVHDAWQGSLPVPAGTARRAEADFGRVYREARSRLPVSPPMEDAYAARYGARGTVLYPCRRRGALRLERPPDRTPEAGAFRFAFAGSAPSAGMRRSLVGFAHAAARVGARLRIYQHLRRSDLEAAGLATDNVELRPFLPADELHRELVRECDALFLPMSFAPEDAANVRLCFPSKLTDYSVPGLPILVWAPPEGTAVRWARENPGAAEVVTEAEDEALDPILRRLISDPGRRRDLGAAALSAGDRLFSQPSVFAVLAACLTSSPS